MDYGIIYIVTNTVNGKQYVGQTTLTLTDRWKHHRESALDYFSMGALHCAIRKYGVEAFAIEQIDVAGSQDELNEREIHHVARLGTYGGGYNLRPGGERWRLSEETRRKISESSKSRVISEKTRRKLSESSWNRKKTSCKNGHLFLEVNTYISLNGSRSCVACRYLAGGRKIPKKLAAILSNSRENPVV